MSPDHAPRVSVCIANYRGEHLLPDCLESVLAQDYAGEVEILVHDDASPDGSVSLLRRDYPQVRLIASDRNVGFCVANNRMAAQAGGNYLLLLNNDAALLPGTIAALVAAAERETRSCILSVDQRRWSDGALIDRGCLLDPFNNPVPNLDPGREEVAMVMGACLFLPTELWHQLGGFPEWMGSIAEDLYLCGLARLRGLPVKVLREGGYRHRQGESFGGAKAGPGALVTTYRRRALSERNKTLAMAVLTPGPVLVPLLALHLLLLAVEGAILSLGKRDRRLWREVYWPALRCLRTHARQVEAERRRAQASRKVSLAGYFRPMSLMPRKLVLLWQHGLPHVQ